MTDKQYSAYKYLSRLWRIRREIQDKEDELRSACLASGIRYDKVNVQTSPSDPMDRIASLVSEIKQEHEQYVALQHEMINRIHGLEDKVFEQILADRFIKALTIKQITRRHGYSVPTTYRLFCKALDAFAEEYENK